MDTSIRQARWRNILGADVFSQETTPDIKTSLLDMLDDPQTFETADACGQWLQDIRQSFSKDDAIYLQRDALEHKCFMRHLPKPLLYRNLLPDSRIIPRLASQKMTKRQEYELRKIISLWVDLIIPRLEKKLLNNRLNPRKKIDYNKTIIKSLRNYNPKTGKVIPQAIYYKKEPGKLGNLTILIDCSESMAQAGVELVLTAAALSRISGKTIRLFAFSEDVTELDSHDIVGSLFSLRPSGGTDISRALRFTAPNAHNSTVVLLSDLLHGGSESELLDSCENLMSSGSKLVLALPLSAKGEKLYSEPTALMLRGMGAEELKIRTGETHDLYNTLLHHRVRDF